MFVLEYIKRKNFLDKSKKKKLVLETNIVNEEELNLEKFKEEISEELGAISLQDNEEKNNFKEENHDSL